jgi:hypothetical protein
MIDKFVHRLCLIIAVNWSIHGSADLIMSYMHATVANRSRRITGIVQLITPAAQSE